MALVEYEGSIVELVKALEAGQYNSAPGTALQVEEVDVSGITRVVYGPDGKLVSSEPLANVLVKKIGE